MTDPSEFNPNEFGHAHSQARPPLDATGAVVPPPPPPGYALPPYPPPPPKRSWLKRLAMGLISTLLFVLLASIAVNIYLGMFFVSVTSGPHELPYIEGDGDWSQRIVILPITGMIDGSTAGFVREAMLKLRNDRPKAIVLRVNSGGGGVSASDQIWHELSKFVDETEGQTPIVASFGAMAASGGYYVSMPAQHIFVEPTTLTGSIGVIANAFTVDELLEKIGVTPEIVVATESTKKDGHNPMRPWTDEDRRSLRYILDQAHARFTEIVDQGRSDLDLEQVRKLATGELYTAHQALDNKLADEEGYLHKAIDKAKELAGFGADANPMVTLLKPAQRWGFGGGLRAAGFDPTTWTSQQTRRWISELSAMQLEYRVVQ